MKRVALFSRHPHCSLDCCNGVMNSLYPDFQIKLFNESHIERGFFNDIDLIAVPGGIGDSEKFHKLFKDRSKIRVLQDYIHQGGAYLGICMGAYWADKMYFNIVHDVRAVQYITRPETDTRRPHPKAIDVNWQGNPIKMYFYDGCALIGDESRYKVVARYANGDPAAIIQGRVGLIGPHPEADRYWYEKPKYMLKHWHYDAQKLLLKDFVNTIIDNEQFKRLF